MTEHTPSKRYPPALLATCLLPWNERHEFMDELFREHVRLLRARLTSHLYLFGTAGEGYAVSDRQFEHIARIFREETDIADTHTMLGIISLSLKTIIERIEIGLDMGFDTFQIALPSWGVLSDRELDAFFAETCGRFPDASFLHYNLGRAGRVLDGETYHRLASRHPNLVATKTGGADRAQAIDMLERAPRIQHFFTEQTYALVRDEHECGFLASIATTHPQKARQYHAARGAELADMRAQIQTLHRNLFAAVGDAGHMDGVYDKIFAKVNQPAFPLRLLPPYTSADDRCFDQFRDSLPPAWRPDS